MEPKELLTKRKIEKLAEEYSHYDLPILDEKYENNLELVVFVSHSAHSYEDREFIKKVLLFLKYSKGGVQGYVDWQDPYMSRETDGYTAVHLKERIKRAKKVIYVVTNDSLKSVWCSWEIGFADSAKDVNNIAILAIKPNNGKWKKNEYLQQYPWISYDLKEKLFLVTVPGNDPITLYKWLKK